MQESNWFVYIIKCGDNSLYTGITTNIPRRLEQHKSGKGAKYTKGRGELQLVYSERQLDKSSALKREIAIKSMKKPLKLELINNLNG
jgi:putative endonuclease